MARKKPIKDHLALFLALQSSQNRLVSAVEVISIRLIVPRTLSAREVVVAAGQTNVDGVRRLPARTRNGETAAIEVVAGVGAAIVTIDEIHGIADEEGRGATPRHDHLRCPPPD